MIKKEKNKTRLMRKECFTLNKNIYKPENMLKKEIKRNKATTRQEEILLAGMWIESYPKPTLNKREKTLLEFLQENIYVTKNEIFNGIGIQNPADSIMKLRRAGHWIRTEYYKDSNGIKKCVYKYLDIPVIGYDYD